MIFTSLLPYIGQNMLFFVKNFSSKLSKTPVFMQLYGSWCYYTSFIYSTNNSCCLHIFTPFLYSKSAKSPAFMQVFGICWFTQITPRLSQFYLFFRLSLLDIRGWRTWVELLFLFIVSITLFVEIMSRISNCF